MGRSYNINPFEYGNQSTDIKNSARHGRRPTLIIDEMAPASNRDNDFMPSPFKSKLLGAWLLLCVTILALQAFHLQIIQGTERLDQAEHNRIRLERIPARRGLIEDRDGQPLVENIPNFILTATPNALPEADSERLDLLRRVSEIIQRPLDEIVAKLDDYSLRSNRTISIADLLNENQALEIITSLDELPGINIEIDSIRNYLADNEFSHLLGYVGRVSDADLAAHPEFSTLDLVGKSGLEAFYDGMLRGQNGYRGVERDHLNQEKRIITSQTPTAGLTLTTSIDNGLQKILSTSLSQTIQKLHTTGGAAIALDPRNGSVLALVSVPGYDVNAFARGIDVPQYQALLNDPNKPFLNRSISGEYPSGSTIKPMIASAALQDKIITPQTTILSQGGITIDRWFFPDWKSGGHGWSNLKKALAESVNTFFYTIGGGFEDFNGLGINRLNEYAKQFGLGDLTSIDLPGERPGFLPTKLWKETVKKEAWYIGDTYHLSIGQGDLLVTPLQIANLTAIVANDGIFYRPHIAQAWRRSDGTVVETVKPDIIRKSFIKPVYLQAVREGLREAVLTGSAQSINDLSVSVAGKTGTAEFGDQGKTHAWFTAFAPYESPEVVITVIVEGGGEGYASALPVVKQGLIEYFQTAAVEN